MSAITVDRVLAANPCDYWPRERIERVAARYGGSASWGEVLRDQRIPAADRVWLWAALGPSDAVRAWAYRCADRAVRVYAPTALDAADLVEHAATLRGLGEVCGVGTARTARDAAWDAAAAAWNAAGAAAAAAGAAAGAAARDAGAAARVAAAAADAARAAAWDAARAAERLAAAAARDAWPAELRRQLRDARELAQ